MLNFNNLRSRAACILTVLLVCACDSDNGTSTATASDSDGSSTSTSTTSTSSTTTTTTTTTPTTTDPTGDSSSSTAGETTGETTGDTTDISSSTTTSTTTGSSTGDEGSGSLREACQPLCEKAINECDVGFPLDSVDLCVNSCVNNHAEEMGACLEGAIDWLDCIAALECPGLSDALVYGESGTCTDIAEAYLGACP